MRNLLITLTASVMLAFAPMANAAADADADALADDVLARNNQIIEQLATAKSGGSELTSADTLKIIQAEMSPILNFPKITRRAMGKFWKKTNDAERQKITSTFRSLLENTYAKVLTKYKNQKVKKVAVKNLPDGNISVLVEVLGDRPVQLDYVFSPSESGDFLISDIKVEKISLISNYRRQFKSLISAGGTEGLVKKLEALALKKAK